MSEIGSGAVEQSKLAPVVKQILNSGRLQGKYITRGTAHFLAETLLDSETGHFYAEAGLNEATCQVISKKALQIILEDTSLVYKTIKLQISRNSLPKSMKLRWFKTNTK